MSQEHGVLLFFWGMISFIGLMFCGMGWLFERSRMAKRFFLGFLAYALTGWLVMPWMWYGAKQVFLWNVGHINDLEAPVQVMPPTPVTRPSAADTNPEKP